MIAGVTMVRDEADVVASSITNLLDRGVDRIFAADHQSTDGTREILEGFAEVEWIPNDDEAYDQPLWVNRLATLAHEAGADWIIPFDADEFWYPISGLSFPEEFALQSPEVDRLRARGWPHLTWDYRHPELAPPEVGKVAYRWSPDSYVQWGNHGVIAPGEERLGVLEFRHLAFRTFEQFCRKTQGGASRVSLELRAAGICSHWVQFDGFTEEQMREAWGDSHAAGWPAIYDPIPARRVESGS